MGTAVFYHLTRSPLETALAMLIGKSLQASWRVILRGTSPERMAWLDVRLWQGADEGFLAHGLSGSRFDADQPVLLTVGSENANEARCLMALDGAEVHDRECRAFERVCIVFDGNDPAALDRARIQWKELTDAGVPAQYWSEASGQWEKKAEKHGPQG